MLIGVISDTHGLLRPEVGRFLRTCGHIIHAGDVGGEDTLIQVRSIAPSSIVRGNVDDEGWATALPETVTIRLKHRAICVIHDLGRLGMDPAGFDIVVYGHSHIPAIRKEGGVTFLNPGSAGPERFGRPASYAWIEIGPAVRMGIEELKGLP